MNEFGIGTLVFIMLVFGCASIAGGVSNVTASNGPVTCAGKVIHQGDYCEMTRNGSAAGTRSYDQLKAEQAPSTGKTILGIVLILGGTAVTVGCVIGIRNRIRERRQGGV
jgi:hypothetical protein